jgi:hypothetical protein
MWQNPTAHEIESLINTVTRAGMNSLRYAADVLRRSSTEKRLPAAQRRQYIDDLRALIDDVLTDDSLLPQERQRIVGLLRQVDDALVNIQLFGADQVEDAVASVVGVLHANPKLRDRIAKSKWAQRFIGAMGGLLLALAQDAGRLAIERAFEVDDEPQIVAQQDQNGQHADQPTDQPTPR